ncbi:MAG: hypothetical protein P8I38_15610 [Arenicella sp.]|nr:hypothetical protein [Arenicella sp.]
MKKQTTLIATLVLLGSIAQSVFAHEDHETVGSSLSADRTDSANQMRMQHERMRARHESRMEGYLANKVDTDQDGLVTYDEFMANAKTRFEASDLNDDGTITHEERKQSAEIIRKKHREAMLEAKESRLEARKAMRKEEKESLRNEDSNAKDSR